MNVLYRNQTEAPTESGFYYGRPVFLDFDVIVPFPVHIDGAKRYAVVQGIPTPLSELDWYGPVPECREG